MMIAWLFWLYALVIPLSLLPLLADNPDLLGKIPYFPIIGPFYMSFALIAAVLLVGAALGGGMGFILFFLLIMLVFWLWLFYKIGGWILNEGKIMLIVLMLMCLGTILIMSAAMKTLRWLDWISYILTILAFTYVLLRYRYLYEKKSNRLLISRLSDSQKKVRVLVTLDKSIYIKTSSSEISEFLPLSITTLE
jgi:hypothetical protein